jgi:hypothetical protein
VAASAWGDGERFALSIRARMNRSIAPLGQARSLTLGIGVLLGGM